MSTIQLQPISSRLLSCATRLSSLSSTPRRQHARAPPQQQPRQQLTSQHGQRRHYRSSAIACAWKAPSTFDHEQDLRRSVFTSREELEEKFEKSLAPFIDAVIADGMLKASDEAFVKQLACFAYLPKVPIEHILEQGNHEAGRIAKACLVLLRNKDCAAGARRILVDLAYLGEPISIIFEANELLRLHGRVDDRTKQRVRKVAGRGVFPEAATLYARIIEPDDPEGAAAWYERAMETSRPEQRNFTFEASLPLGFIKQHWELYLGLMSRMRDKKAALRAAKIGADQYDQSTACYHLAVIAHGRKDYETKERYLLKAAQDGHVDSCRLLGEQYSRAFLAAWLADPKNGGKIDATMYEVPPEDTKFSKKYDQAMMQLFAEEWLKIAVQQHDNESRVRLACLLHMLGRAKEGFEILQQADEVRSLIRSETAIQKRIPALMKAWNDRWAGRDALITWDFQPRRKEATH